MSTTEKTLCVTVTIEATTDWEPNYFEDNDFSKPADATFEPKHLTMTVRGYAETEVGREVISVERLHERSRSACCRLMSAS